jgi:hypothetical protein
MLVISQKTEATEKFMKKVDKERDEREKLLRENANIRRDLRNMGKDRGKLERGGDKGKIGRFNKDYVGKLSRLSIIRQRHNPEGESRENIKKTVKTWKEKLGF